ncbi:hypothetical protein [Schlesneria sp.]|uniref:hypothetical protein n=1 Tax=Schlesneria sp. TaxID=2762018 RepID=UPI002F0CFCF1
MPDFTDEELLAYADERLSSERSAEIERALRNERLIQDRFVALLSERDRGQTSVGEIWRQGSLSCPSRSVWEAFVTGRLGDGLTQYLKFHVEVIGCRPCAANLADLSHHAHFPESERRTRKIFQSSAGHLPQ